MNDVNERMEKEERINRRERKSKEKGKRENIKRLSEKKREFQTNTKNEMTRRACVRANERVSERENQ